ncbi:hypothetical protein [Streptomyces laurentii]|uniref:hypothetical protein n=1 Tax=Streptomyces laurentii TaxID=39478 RepID=UPI00368B3822
MIVAPYENEYRADDSEILICPSGAVSYRDERPDDRTVEGILLRRWAGEPGGPRRWGEHHTRRQVAAMEFRWCAGCGGRPDVDRRGMLWVLPAARVRPAGSPAGPLLVAMPPLCRADAARALRACEELRNGAVALRVTEAEVVGVRGTVYAGAGGTGRARGGQPCDEVVLFGDPRVRRVVADQLIREITRAEIDHTTLSALTDGPVPPLPLPQITEADDEDEPEQHHHP